MQIADYAPAEVEVQVQARPTPYRQLAFNFDPT